jgi:cystathionine beta-lyase/cystathionine gamma-synthase
MWKEGRISADTCFRDEDTDQWQKLIDAIDSFKPQTRLHKYLNPPPPTEEQTKKDELGAKKGCGCLSLFAGLALAFVAVFTFITPEPTTVTEKSAYPTVRRDTRFPMRDDMARVTYEDVTRPKTKEEIEEYRNTRMIFLIVGAAFLLISVGFYSAYYFQSKR